MLVINFPLPRGGMWVCSTVALAAPGRGRQASGRHTVSAPSNQRRRRARTLLSSTNAVSGDVDRVRANGGPPQAGERFGATPQVVHVPQVEADHRFTRDRWMCDDFGGVVDNVYLILKLTFIPAFNLDANSVHVSPKPQPSSDSDSSSSDGNSVVAELTTGAEAQALVPTRWDELSK